MICIGVDFIIPEMIQFLNREVGQLDKDYWFDTQKVKATSGKTYKYPKRKLFGGYDLYFKREEDAVHFKIMFGENTL